MLGMSDAVSRILRSIDAGEKILVYGDYDVLYPPTFYVID